MISVSTEIRVRYAETDKMGVVYHSNYLVWFEVGRIHLLDEIGTPYREIEENGFRLPVLEVHAAYHRPAGFDDRINIDTSIRELPGVRIKIYYELSRGSEKICTGHTRHAFITSAGEPVRPPDSFVKRVKSLLYKS